VECVHHFTTGSNGPGGGDMNTVEGLLVTSTAMNCLRNAQAIYSRLKNDVTMLIRRGRSSQVSLLKKILFQSSPPPGATLADVLIRRLSSSGRSCI
jgi:hypothetical protein